MNLEVSRFVRHDVLQVQKGGEIETLQSSVSYADILQIRTVQDNECRVDADCFSPYLSSLDMMSDRKKEEK